MKPAFNKTAFEQLTIQQIKQYVEVADFVAASRGKGKVPVHLIELGRRFFGRKGKGAVTKWLTVLEGCWGGRGALFDCRPNQGIFGLTGNGTAARNLLRRYTDSAALVGLAIPSLRPLKVAASKALITYLIPHVISELPGREAFAFEVGEFSQQRTPEHLQSGEVDLALVWDGYKIDYSPLRPKVLPHTRATTHMIFHPLHPFARWLRNSAKRRDENAILTALGTHKLIFPKLRQMKMLANRLAVSGQKLELEGWPAVVNQVQLGLGIGLFPGWPWLLEQIAHDGFIEHIEVPPQAGDQSRQLAVLAVESCHSSADSAAARSTFLSAIGRVLHRLNPLKPVWSFALGPLIDGDFKGNWVGYFITPGPAGRPVAPHWHKFDLDAIRRLRPQHYDCLITTRSYVNKKSVTSSCRVDLTADRMVLEVSESDGMTRSIGTVFKRLKREDSPAANILLGFTHIDGAKPSTGPLLLSNVPLILDYEDHRQLRNMMNFLSRIEGMSYTPG